MVSEIIMTSTPDAPPADPKSNTTLVVSSLIIFFLAIIGTGYVAHKHARFEPIREAARDRLLVLRPTRGLGVEAVGKIPIVTFSAHNRGDKSLASNRRDPQLPRQPEPPRRSAPCCGFKASKPCAPSASTYPGRAPEARQKWQGQDFLQVVQSVPKTIPRATRFENCLAGTSSTRHALTCGFKTGLGLARFGTIRHSISDVERDTC